MPVTQNSSQLYGVLQVALSGMLYGVLGYFGTQLLNEHFSVSAMLFWRFFIATLWMFASITLNKIEFTLSTRYVLIKMILVGVITYSGSSIFYFLASQYIGTGPGMVIFFSYPVFVTCFAWLFSDWQMNKTAFMSLSAVVLGLLFLKGQGEAAFNSLGILYAFVAAFCYAVYVFLSQHSVKVIDARLQTLFICLGNALIFLLLACQSHSFTLPHTVSAWINVLAIGIIATALPIHLLLNGLKFITPIKVSILSVVEPLVTVLVGFIFLNEILSSMQVVGIVILLCGAVLIQFEERQEVKVVK